MTEPSKEILKAIDKLRGWVRLKRGRAQAKLLADQPREFLRADLLDCGFLMARALEAIGPDDGRIAAVGRLRIYDARDYRWLEPLAFNFSPRDLRRDDTLTAIQHPDGFWCGFDPTPLPGEELPEPDPLSLVDGLTIRGQVNKFSSFSQEGVN